MIAEVGKLARLLRCLHHAVDQPGDGKRIAVRVIATQPVTAQFLADETLGSDEDLWLGTAEPVDALLRIADQEDARRATTRTGIARQPAVQRLPLHRVGVLELVDHQVPHPGVQPLLQPA